MAHRCYVNDIRRISVDVYSIIYISFFLFSLWELNKKRLSQGTLTIDKQTNAVTDYNLPKSVGEITENAPECNVQDFYCKVGGHNCKVKFMFAAVWSVCSSVSCRIQLQMKCDTWLAPLFCVAWNEISLKCGQQHHPASEKRNNRSVAGVGYGLISSGCLNEVCLQRFYVYISLLCYRVTEFMWVWGFEL